MNMRRFNFLGLLPGGAIVLLAVLLGMGLQVERVSFSDPGYVSLDDWGIDKGPVTLDVNWRREASRGMDLGVSPVYGGIADQDTLFLTITVPKGLNKQFALYVPYIFSSFSLSVNDQEHLASGVFRPDKRMLWKPQVVVFEVDEPEITIKLETQGGDYFLNGLSGPITFGLTDQIVHFNNKHFIKEAFYFSAFLLIGIFHFAFVRRKDKAPFWMGVYCLQIAIYIVMFPERNLISMLDWPWEYLMKIQMISLVTCLLTFHFFLQCTYFSAASRWISYVIGVVTATQVVIILSTESAEYSKLFLYVFGPSLILICSNAIIHFGLNAVRKKPYAFLNLIGFTVLAVAAISDFLNNAGVTHNPFLVAEGLLFYLTLQALIVKNRYQEAFNQSEKLNRQMRQAYNEIEKNMVEITAAREKADRALASKSYFMALVSHEIRNPIAAAYQTLEYLEDNGNGFSRKLARTALHSMEPLFNLLNDIIDFSTIEYKKSLRFAQQNFDVHTLFVSVCDEHQASAVGKNLILRLDSTPCLSGDKQVVRSDATRIRQVLVNLITNAIKYTEPGGYITVRYALENQVGHDLGYLLSMEVSDTGIGIPQDKQEAIFEYMRQLSDTNIETRIHGGFGLGLAICKQIVEQMQGEISVVSDAGMGSSFTVKLPVELGTLDNIPSSCNVSSDFTDYHILLVEDDPSIRNSTRALLKNVGVSVIEASNATDAYRLFLRHKFDLIFLDCYLPEVSGFELASKIRTYEEQANRRRTPIIGLSASPQTEVVDLVYRSGMDDFMSKPYKKFDLYQKVSMLSQWNREIEPFMS